MKEFKDSKIRAKKKSSKSNKDIFDSLSITRELEKSLTIHEELEKEKIRVRNIQKRKLQKNILKGVFIAFIAHAHQLQHFVDTVFYLSLILPPGGTEHKLKIVVHRTVGKQLEVLKYDTQLAT